MKELINKNQFDLERIIKNSNKKGKNKKTREIIIEANYILDTLSQKLAISSEELKKAKIKTIETLVTTSKINNKPKNKRKRVIKYFVMTPKDRLEIIKQVTIYSKVNKVKDLDRTLEIMDKETKINLGYITEDEKINYLNPAIYKLVPKK